MSSAIWGAGQDVYSLECAANGFDGSTMRLCKRLNGGACQIIERPFPEFPECNYSGGYEIAAEWLYLVLPLMVMVFVIRRLISLFSGENE